MLIHIEALTLDVIIGLLEFEREIPQRIIVDIESSYDYANEDFINYADMVLLIQQELEEGQYKLLEEALLGIKTRLYQVYPQLKTLNIKISKPDILPQCSVALSHNWEF